MVFKTVSYQKLAIFPAADINLGHTTDLVQL